MAGLSRHKQVSTLINHFWPIWDTLSADCHWLGCWLLTHLVKTNSSIAQNLGNIQPAKQPSQSNPSQETKPTKYVKMQVAKLDRKTQKRQNYKYFAFLRHCAKSTEKAMKEKKIVNILTTLQILIFRLCETNYLYACFYPQYLHCANFMFILLITAK